MRAIDVMVKCTGAGSVAFDHDSTRRIERSNFRVRSVRAVLVVEVPGPQVGGNGNPDPPGDRPDAVLSDRRARQPVRFPVPSRGARRKSR